MATTLLTAVALGLVIGAALGGLGGGGAIITVPALVYLGGQSGQEATTSSLVVIGVSALIGALSYLSTGRVRWGTALVFTIAGLPAAWLGSYLNHRADENVLLLGFAALMLVGATAMMADNRPEPASNDASGSRVTPSRSADRSRPGLAALAVVTAALAVGFMTGFFGVGGGFVIVPVLAVVLRVPMEHVVGTSLMVVALNSGTALLSRASSAHFDWSVILPLTLSAAFATFLGKRVADRLPARRLKLTFAGLLVLVAAYTALQSGLAIAHDAGAVVAVGPADDKLTKLSEQVNASH